MEDDRILIHERPKIKAPRLVLGFSGWMNGGEVSTGTVQYLCNKIDVSLLAELDSEDFYIQNFPGTMEVTSIFRPYARIENGLVTEYIAPTNEFYYCEEHNLILFLGKEPNIKWFEYSEAIFQIVEKFDVSMIYFLGSVGGAVPHTRQPRILASISDSKLQSSIKQLGIHLSDYEGPVGISTYLTQEAADREVPMIVLVAEIPPYVHGKNPRCIETMVKLICGLLLIHLDHDELRAMGDDLEKKLDKALSKHPELEERIRELEDSYDKEIFDDRLGDMKQWLAERGIRLD
jgi:proteasome assembly chaperone (PAC2) family protein